jgi:hypothetical protein
VLGFLVSFLQTMVRMSSVLTLAGGIADGLTPESSFGVELSGRVRPALVGAVPVLGLSSCSTADKKLNLVSGRRSWTAGAGGGRPARPARAPADLGGAAARSTLTSARATFDGYNTGLY